MHPHKEIIDKSIELTKTKIESDSMLLTSYEDVRDFFLIVARQLGLPDEIDFGISKEAVYGWGKAIIMIVDGHEAVQKHFDDPQQRVEAVKAVSIYQVNQALEIQEGFSPTTLKKIDRVFDDKKVKGAITVEGIGLSTSDVKKIIIDMLVTYSRSINLITLNGVMPAEFSLAFDNTK